jgi:hypothetical protein
MNGITLPQHIINRIERRWAAQFGQMIATASVSNAPVPVLASQRRLNQGGEPKSLRSLFVRAAPLISTTFLTGGK